MSGPLGSDVQRAIEFLSGPDAAGLDRLSLPPRPDYERLARHASELGHELSPDSVREAFRLIMRVRLLALGKPSRSERDDP